MLWNLPKSKQSKWSESSSLRSRAGEQVDGKQPSYRHNLMCSHRVSSESLKLCCPLQLTVFTPCVTISGNLQFVASKHRITNFSSCSLAWVNSSVVKQGWYIVNGIVQAVHSNMPHNPCVSSYCLTKLNIMD